MTSPTARSLALLRALGMRAEVVERWNPHSKTRHDLFGFADLLALGQGSILAVQATSSANLSARMRKMEGLDALFDWLAAGGRVEAWGWKRRQGRWMVRRAVLARVESSRGELLGWDWEMQDAARPAEIVAMSRGGKRT